jgi:hypothetical protein
MRRVRPDYPTLTSTPTTTSTSTSALVADPIIIIIITG